MTLKVIKGGFDKNNSNLKTLRDELSEIMSHLTEEELNTPVRTVLLMFMNEDQSTRFIPSENAMFRDTLYMCDDVRHSAWDAYIKGEGYA